MWSLFWRLDRIVFQIVNNMLLWCFNSDYMIKPLSHHLVIPHSRFELELEKKILLFSEQHQLSGYRKSCYDLNRHLTSTLWISEHIKHKFPETFFFVGMQSISIFRHVLVHALVQKFQYGVAENVSYSIVQWFIAMWCMCDSFFMYDSPSLLVSIVMCVCACVFSVATILSNFLPFDSIDFQSKF